MNKTLVKKPSLRLISGLFLLVLAIMPVHTFFSTWIGSELGNTDAVKAIKDGLVFTAGLLLAWELKNNRSLLKILGDSWVNRAIVTFALLHLLVFAFIRPELDAAIVGLVFNTRYLLFFIIAQALSYQLKPDFRAKALRIVLVMGLVVSVFGFLQVTVLDRNVLENFGYGEDTVRPFLTIDANDDYVRINSTLRGPNELGAYLAVLVFVALVAWTKRPSAVGGDKWRHLVLIGVPFWLVSFWNAQSRSAAVGLAVGLVAYGFLIVLGKPRYRRAVVTGVVASAVLLPAGYLAIKDTNFYQIVVLHDDKSDNKTTSSNINRLNAYSRAVEDLNEHPFGRGPGTSGPASTYNSKISRFSENYFLQIGQEIGYLGIAALMSIVGLALVRLWRIKTTAAYALFGGLVGFTVINLFLHGWADDATSLIFWGVLGLYINDKPKA